MSERSRSRHRGLAGGRFVGAHKVIDLRRDHRCQRVANDDDPEPVVEGRPEDLFPCDRSCHGRPGDERAKDHQ
jgi:hypothetical protein